MADKQLTFDEDARASLMRGVDELKRVVGLTLGPSGRNVLLSRMFGLPVVCSDGVTVAKEVELPSPTRTLALNWLKKPPPRPTTRSATAQPHPWCWPSRSSGTAS